MIYFCNLSEFRIPEFSDDVTLGYGRNKEATSSGRGGATHDTINISYLDNF